MNETVQQVRAVSWFCWLVAFILFHKMFFITLLFARTRSFSIPFKFTLRISRYFREFFNTIYILYAWTECMHMIALKIIRCVSFCSVGQKRDHSIFLGSKESKFSEWNGTICWADSITFQICKNYILQTVCQFFVCIAGNESESTVLIWFFLYDHILLVLP